jgi:hypothetical protein
MDLRGLVRMAIVGGNHQAVFVPYFTYVGTEKMYRESFLGRKIVGQTWLDCK